MSLTFTFVVNVVLDWLGADVINEDLNPSRWY